MTLAGVLVATCVGVVGTDEIDVVNEVPLLEVLEVLMGLIFPKFVFSGWISMVSLLMSEALVVENWSFLLQVHEVVTGNFMVVPCIIDTWPSISIDPEVIVSAWVSMVGGEQGAAMLVSAACVFIVACLGVLAADFVSVLLVVPLHEVGWDVVVLVFPELVAPCWVTMVRFFVVDVSAEIHVCVCVFKIYLYNLRYLD